MSKRLCYYCGVAPIKGKKSTSKYCSNSCKSRAYEQRKGMKVPSFVGEVKKAQAKKSQLVNQFTPTNISYNLPTDEIKISELQMNHWYKVWQDAEKGIFPLAVISGAVIGGGIAKDSQTKTDCKTTKGKYKCTTRKNPDATPTLIGAGIGALIGYAVDEYRKKTTIETAQRNFYHFRNKVRELKRLLRTTKRMEIEGKVIKSDNVVKISHPEIVSSEYYLSQIIPELKFTDRWKYLIGNPSENFFTMIYGQRGNGKSTLAVQFAKYLQENHGKTLYLSSEQPGVNAQLQKLGKTFKTSFDWHTKANRFDTEKAVETISKYRFVIIDSINHIGWSANQLEHLREKCPNTAFVCLFQSTKDGNYKGSEEFAHNCDVIIECKKLVAYQTKSRFTGNSHIHIIPPEYESQFNIK